LRVNGPSPQRLLPIYRSPTHVILSYAGIEVAPHVETTRATHTVPTGYAAIVSGAYVQLVRATAPTTLDEVWGRVLTGAGVLLRIHHVNANVGTSEFGSVPCESFEAEGNLIQLKTADNSIGGTMYYSLAVNLVEFIYDV